MFARFWHHSTRARSSAPPPGTEISTTPLYQLNLQMSFVRGEALGYGEESDKWIAGSGLVENIDRVVTEYRDWRSLQPMRVLFHGPPASYWYKNPAVLGGVWYCGTERLVLSGVSGTTLQTARRYPVLT